MADPTLDHIDHALESWDTIFNDNMDKIDANFMRTTKSAAHGQKIYIEHVEVESAALSGATGTLANLIPAGATVLAVTARVTTLITGATTWDLGDGTTVDLFAAAKALTAGTTSDLTDHKSTWAGAKYYKTTTSVVITANGSNFTAGKIRVSIAYFKSVAPTS